MSALQRAESSLEWWDETELPRLREVATADPTNVDAQTLLQRAENHRELAYVQASAAYDRECEVEYAAQWASWAFGPDVNEGTR